MNKKNAVLLFNPTNVTSGKAEGVCRYAKERGWRVITIRDYWRFGRSAASMLDVWNVIGAIVVSELGVKESLRAIIARGVPVVWFDKTPLSRTVRWAVNQDASKAGRMAAEALLAREFAFYAYIGDVEPLWWSSERGAAFVSAVKTAGMPCARYEVKKGTPFNEDRRGLADFLKKLPRPAGVFVSNDTRAYDVLNTCAALGIRIPEDMAVLSCDNNESICESTEPTLSSLDLNPFDGGYKAAELLDGLARMKRRPAGRIVRFGDIRLVERGSTGRRPGFDRVASGAMEFIRVNAGRGIGVADVARHTKVSVRTLNLRFAEMVGHSVAEEIRAVRLDMIKAALISTDEPISLIAQECGFSSDVTSKVFFKRETGMSMREFRRRHRPGAGEG